MDLSFNRFDKETLVTQLPADLAVLMVGIAARQAASFTAIAQTRLLQVGEETVLFAPAHGAFNGPVATVLLRWKEA